MDRKTKGKKPMPLRTLGEDELTMVSGACHGRRHHHRRHHHECGDRGESALASPGATPAAAPGAINLVDFLQSLNINIVGNTAPVFVVLQNLFAIG